MTDFEQKIIAGQELDIGQTTDATSGTVAALSSLNKSDIRLTAVTTLQGIANGFSGKLLYIFNASVSPITIANDSGSATAANRILTGTGGNFTLAIDSGITLVYDSTTSRWRIAGNGTPGPQGVQGSQGSQGNQGFQGSPGSQGNQGFQGSPGAQGNQGFQGPPGAQGNQGFQGSPGTATASTYTPTLTNITNISTKTAYVWQYSQVGTGSGSVVTVSGRFDVVATSGNNAIPVDSVLTASLPVTVGNFNSATSGASGSGNSIQNLQGLAVEVNNGTKTVFLEWNATTTATCTFWLIFTYTVI